MAQFESQGAIAFDAASRDFLGLVGGIVQQLDLEQTGRIIEARNGLDQALNYIALVIDGKLYSYLRPKGRFGGLNGDVGAVLGVAID